MIIIGAAQGGEGVGDALPGQPLAQRPQRLQHAGHTCVPAEEDQPPARIVRHLFVVDQRTAQVQHALQHGHVEWLALDDVGEEDVGLARQKGGFGDLLDAQNQRAVSQTLLHQRAGRLELGCREGALRRRLDDHLDAMLPAQLSGNSWGDGGAALPGALILAAHANAMLHKYAP